MDQGLEVGWNVGAVSLSVSHVQRPQLGQGRQGTDLEVGEGIVTEYWQVWSLTQFYSVDISQSRIIVNKCVFYKRTIKVYVSCC